MARIGKTAIALMVSVPLVLFRPPGTARPAAEAAPASGCASAPLDGECRDKLTALYKKVARERFSTTAEVCHIRMRQTSYNRGKGANPTVSTSEVEVFQNSEASYYKTKDGEYMHYQDKAYYIIHPLKRIYIMSWQQPATFDHSTNVAILEGQMAHIKEAKSITCEKAKGSPNRMMSLVPADEMKKDLGLERIVFELDPAGKTLLNQTFYFSKEKPVVKQRLDFLEVNPAYSKKRQFVSELILPNGKLRKDLEQYTIHS